MVLRDPRYKETDCEHLNPLNPWWWNDNMSKNCPYFTTVNNLSCYISFHEATPLSSPFSKHMVCVINKWNVANKTHKICSFKIRLQSY